jgi:hypothetical protein
MLQLQYMIKLMYISVETTIGSSIPMQPVLQAVVSGMFTIVYLYISEALPVALFEQWVLLLGVLFSIFF